jgi:NADH-quinone oxidoreductase subunit H
VFVIGLVATMLMVWFERKAIAGMQNRSVRRRPGPFGILQTLADGIKLFFKEDLIPERSTGSCSSSRRTSRSCRRSSCGR